MAPAQLLQRNVKPSKAANDDESDEAELIDEGFSEENISDAGNDEEPSLRENGQSELEADEQRTHDNESSEEDVEQALNKVSFGALLQAQSSISRKRKRGSDITAEQDAKLDAVRARLKEIQSQAKSKKPADIARATSGRRREEDVEDEDSADDSDSAPSEEGATSKSRSSKHAPATQSSRHQVTRKRIVVDVPKRVIRDPRFDAIQQQSAYLGTNEKAYDFLQDYQQAEVKELKAAIKQTRNEEDKEKLRRKMVSMENRLKSKAAKDREQQVVRQHRKEEREKVQHGKKPFFLKQKDIKERAVVEKFNSMKGKDREKLLERRRRKEGQKEKKRMPDARRGAG